MPMGDRRLQVYQTDQLRITFDPAICQDSGVCLRTLPAVFDRTRSCWVQPEHASSAAIMACVAKCPSGALRAQLVTSVHRSFTPDGDAGQATG
jgi:uncharacterized Fe-S cluster protein YjdI